MRPTILIVSLALVGTGCGALKEFQNATPEEQQSAVEATKQSVRDTAAAIRTAVPAAEPWLSMGETIILSAIGLGGAILGGKKLKDAPNKAQKDAEAKALIADALKES